MEAFRDRKDNIRGKSTLIFLVTGTQEPFDRMIEIVDKWLDNNSGDYRVVAQTANSNYQAKNIECFDFLEPAKFTELFANSDFIVGHAGIGTIIKALELRKKLIVFPRLTEFKEHRNDHQIHTAKSFQELDYVTVAYTNEELVKTLNEIEKIPEKNGISPNADESLIDEIKRFINNLGDK